MEKYYDITGINKDTLLQALWHNSTNKYNKNNYPFNIKIAKIQMYQNYPDYVCGRPIKVDLYNHNEVSGYLYDRDNGENAFNNVVEQVRENKNSPPLFNNTNKKNCTNTTTNYNFNDKEVIDLYKEMFL
tara:strand:+ start:175 stop:561 length:387 start_codon:yes stop_codon:yes gene_type:complete